MIIKSWISDVLRNIIPLATEIAHCGVWKQDFERAKKHDLGVLHLVNRDPEYACCVSMMLLCVYFFFADKPVIGYSIGQWTELWEQIPEIQR